ncbi:hypothetical protein [Rhodoplanes sp. Z2-YC6860]|uniref:hypothetical protein n=1 Tax=Rhodoplanes sp. Z2-YC6860 TaxID=674703 RepID=UPI00078E7F5F|nr:hypothetical protein [Rhodoplanes sp. Z2-YC6860]AMN40997.1 hypothetical protein RHPLAN_25590 [Rhodoplanes sp. Z2-YC6860]
MPNINPVTGLSTDYLNHFTEALMALEMAADIPECLDDLKAWEPKTYAEHFAASPFTNRLAVIDLYRAAPLRRETDRLAGAILGQLIEARTEATGGGDIAAIGRHATATIRPLIAELAALINGAAHNPAERLSSQAAIDAMFHG